MSKAGSWLARRAVPASLFLASASARAAFLSGELLDTAADWVAIIVLIVVPVAAIVVFWLVHILPEKIAEQRHHPQKDSIKVLCLLSLVFGGLLWPIAWLWAYTRPVLYRSAYGVDRHEDYFTEMGEKARAGQLLRGELAHLREELDAMEAKGALPPQLRGLRAELDGLHERATTSAEGGR
jgi:CBS domain containing-hemolysin-like protein